MGGSGPGWCNRLHTFTWGSCFQRPEPDLLRVVYDQRVVALGEDPDAAVDDAVPAARGEDRRSRGDERVSRDALGCSRGDKPSSR